MMLFRFLFCVAAFSLVSAQITSLLSSGGSRNYNHDLSEEELRNLYNSRVHEAVWKTRPFGGSGSSVYPLCHSGVEVTLDDGSKWLIHKGDGYGISSQTVVTDARHMGSDWEPRQTRDFMGTKTVADFVKAGGSNYNVFLNNCHLTAKRMMNQ